MIGYDYTFACADAVQGGGLTEDALAALRTRAVEAVAVLQELSDAGESFLSAPDADLIPVQAMANVLRERNENGLVVGIGGSSLGAKCVHDALVRELSGAWRDGSARDGVDLFFADNVDPMEVSDLLACLPLDDTLFCVVTKSGCTIESMSTFLRFRAELLEQADGVYQEQVVAITDPELGDLRALVVAEGLQSLAIPPGVGGRFSVFTPAGTFPLALAGVDVEAFLRGAATARDAALRTNIEDNPAACFAMVQCGLYEAGVHDVVMMPYASSLSAVSQWFVQLWAESLGKGTPAGPVGPTPIPAVGATDQHSQLQLFMEGPATKNVVFVELETDAVDVAVPPAPESCASLAHLGGKTLHQIRAAELAGVRGALASVGRPTSTFTLPKVDAEVLGELLMTLACATALSGTLLGVNPFDQPGVEHAKRIAHGLLGREGEATAPASVPRRRAANV